MSSVSRQSRAAVVYRQNANEDPERVNDNDDTQASILKRTLEKNAGSTNELEPARRSIQSNDREDSIEGNTLKQNPKNGPQVGSEDDSDLMSLSSLEDADAYSVDATSIQSHVQDEDDDFVDGKPVPRFSDGSKCHPQRRCHFLEIPFGTSGALKRRVFEVRERLVEPCSLEDQVLASQPRVRHASTNMIVVRWDMSSWAEAKRITQFELQWRQVGLRQGEYLEIPASKADADDGNRESQVLSGELEPVKPESSAEAAFGTVDALQTNSLSKAQAYHTVICDGQFSTMPTAVIRQIDLRAEVRLHGLPGSCAPLIFRVRTKLGHLGWGQWSPESEPIQTLPNICDDLTPRLECATAHSVRLKWCAPANKAYGKVVRYRLFAALAKAKHLKGDVETQDYCDETVELLNDDDEEIAKEASREVGWALIYEGLEEEIGIGKEPRLKNSDSEMRAHDLLAKSLYSKGSNLHAIGLEQGLLPSSWPIFVKLEADMGSWFHGEYFANDVRSPATQVITYDPIPDPPPPPETLPYHGTIQARHILLYLRPSQTYGNGHPAETYKFMYPGRDASNWFGLDIAEGLKNPKSFQRQALKQKTIDLWKEATENFEQEMAAEKDDLRREGWTQDKEGIWNSSLSHEEQVNHPYVDDLPIAEFILMGRMLSAEIIHPFRELYRGPSRHVHLSKLDPTTKYEFYVTTSARMTTYGSSEPSGRTIVATQLESTEKLSLPQGWVELWDPVSEYVYFHESSSTTIQWEHPAGANIDDPELRFRTLRFRLLHRLYQRLPPAQNVETHKIYLNRKKLVQDSYREVGLLKKEQLCGKFNVHFEGESGIDSGGITTEWYHLLTKALFQPEAKLVICTEACSRYSLMPAPRIAGDDRRWHLDRCFMLGRIMAKAVYDKRVVNTPFCTYIYKHLLGIPPDMDDLRQVDPVYHQSLEWMLHHEISDIIFQPFTVHDKNEIEHDLIPGGSHVDVTDANKHEYVEKVVEWLLTKSVSDEMERICAGFHELFPVDELNEFTVAYLEHLINGSEEIPVSELRGAARYANGFSARSKAVQYFWAFMEGASPSKQAAILAFATGSSKMPLEPLSMQIVKSQEGCDALPTSHTCFQQLVIPDYESLQQLEEKFEVALDHAQHGGFMMT